MNDHAIPVPSHLRSNANLRKALESLGLDVAEVVRFLCMGERAWQVSGPQVARLFGVTSFARATDVVNRLVRVGALVPLRSRRGRIEHYSRRAVERLIVATADGRLRFIASGLLAAGRQQRWGAPEAFVIGPEFLAGLLAEVGAEGWHEDEAPA
jgi:transposase InsO family protein